MSVEFENAWYDLNERLRDLESSTGLTEALHALELHHLTSGFIDSSVNELERYTYFHPKDPTRYFRVQYNPRRALRFNGAGLDKDRQVANDKGCFLCRDNIELQQHGAQLGYRIETGQRAYTALTNPFPIFPGHMVVAAAEHCPQEWRFRSDRGLNIASLIDDLVNLAVRMPGYLGFYNGVGAGSTIPEHLHFQFLLRADEHGIFPLEVAAQNTAIGSNHFGFVDDYPLDVAVWRGNATDVAKRASTWMARWGERNRERLHLLSGNFIATCDGDDEPLTLYFVPRDRTKTHAYGFSGHAGGLEVMGEIVFSHPDEKARIVDGSIDYFTLRSALTSLHTPPFVDT